MFLVSNALGVVMSLDLLAMVLFVCIVENPIGTLIIYNGFRGIGPTKIS